MRLSSIEVADLIDRFLRGEVGPYEWDDFISIRSRDPRIERVRRECLEIPDRYPTESGYCNDAGVARLRELASSLRAQTRRS